MTSAAAPANTPAEPLAPLILPPAATGGSKRRRKRANRGEPITARQQITGLLFVAPYLIGMIVFLVVPLVMALYLSFCNYNMLQWPPLWTGLRNYTNLAHDHVFLIALVNTIVFAAISVPVSLGISFLLAVLLNQPVRGQGVYRTIIFLPSLVPAVATALMWQWLYNDQIGLINILLRPPLHYIGLAVAWLDAAFGANAATVAAWRHLEPPAWLNQPNWAMTAIIFMGLWGVGQTVVIFLAGLQDVPKSLYEAAEIDGAGAGRRLWHVTLPMLSPVIFFNLIMGIIGSWQIFDVPYVMTGGGPNRATTFYSMYLFQAGFMQLRMGAASAMAWIQFLIIVGLTVVAFWTARKWVHYG